LTKHLKEVLGLMAKKVKSGRLSTFERSPQHQNYAKMNVRILRNVMAVRKWNDQKVTSYARAKTHREWAKLVIITK
jgi:hypothetical protein